MASTTDRLIMELRARDAGLQRNLKQINMQLRQMGVNSGTAGAGLDRAGRKAKGFQARATGAMTAVKGLAGAFALLALRSAVGVFVGFRTEMNNVRAITNATEEEFQELIATSKHLGATTQFTARETASAMTFLARTGLDVTQVMGALPPTLDLAAATATDLATSADIATNIMKAMGLEVSELTNVVDVLAKTTNSSNVDLISLAEGMKYVAPVAATAGMSLTEVAAIIGKLGDAGIQGSLAGVALRRSIINLTTGTGAAGGAIERLGLKVRDSQGNFVGLTEVIRQLGERAVSDKDLVALFGARAVAAANVLRNVGAEGIRKFAEELENAGGTAKRMREQQMEGLVGAAKRVRSSFEATQIFLGEAMAPALTALADILTNYVLPGIRRFIAGWQLVGSAVYVAAESVVSGGELIWNTIVSVVGGAVQKFGRMVQRIGDLAAMLGFKVGLGMQEAGLALQEWGVDATSRAQSRMENNLNMIRLAYQAAVDEAKELGQALGGADYQAAAGAMDQLGEAIDNMSDNLAETNVELERQQELIDDLAETFAGAMLTAAERAKGALVKLRADMVAAGVEITEVMEQQFAALMEKAEEALRTERATAMAKSFRDALEQELSQIAFEGLGADTEEERLVIIDRQRDAIESQIALARERLENTKLEKEEEEALIRLILEFNKALGTATKEQKRLLETIKGSGEDVLKNLQHTIQLISQAVDGALNLAKAFGVLNDEQAQTVRNMKDIVEGGATAAAGISSGNIPAMISGGLQFLGGIAGLFSGGPSPTQRALEANVQAMYLLGDRMADLAKTLENQTEKLERALELTRRVEEFRPSPGLTFRGVKLSPAEFREIYRAAQAVGITLPEGLLERAAAGQDVFLPADIAAQLGDVLTDVLGEISDSVEEGTTQSITKSVAITELQANQLLAYQASQLEVLEGILAVLSGGEALVGAPGVRGTAPGATITIGPNEIHLGGGTAREQADDFVEQVLQLAGERLTDQDQLLGVSR